MSGRLAITNWVKPKAEENVCAPQHQRCKLFECKLRVLA
ncbi:hypothetical protein FHS25_003644 [Rhizobium laguerreae]|uniref:Uncharacterized protein n=1 Tax=Rhizobium laguerreae TaxID=1076926 RepID=A0ABR6GA79_9HYPH|nr:hypothetical protein [Rhizobium laguerreae]